MKREEALQTATVAVSDFDRARKERWNKRGDPALGPSCPPLNAQDWANPSLHQVLVALEALGVLKFEDEVGTPPKKAGYIYVKDSDTLQGHLFRATDLYDALRGAGRIVSRRPVPFEGTKNREDARRILMECGYTKSDAEQFIRIPPSSAEDAAQYLRERGYVVSKSSEEPPLTRAEVIELINGMPDSCFLVSAHSIKAVKNQMIHFICENHGL